MKTIIVMGQVLRALEQRVRVALAEHELSLAVLEILAWLDDQRVASCAFIAARSGRSRQSLQRSLEQLERRGLVQRLDSVISHRTEGWALTATGERTFETCARALAGMETEFLTAVHFDPHRFTELLEIATNVAHGRFVFKRDGHNAFVVDLPPPPPTPEWDL